MPVSKIGTFNSVAVFLSNTYVCPLLRTNMHIFILTYVHTYKHA